jgi:hypothetical protein
MARTFQAIYDDLVTSTRTAMASYLTDATQVVYFSSLLTKIAEQSRVGVINTILSVVAGGIWAFEKIHDSFLAAVDARTAQANIGTLGWFVKICFQYRPNKVFVSNANYTLDYVLPTGVTDDGGQTVQFVSVQERGNVVYIKVQAEDNQVLDPDTQLPQFKGYIERIKPLGVATIVVSKVADSVSVTATVVYNKARNPGDADSYVHGAITNYLESISTTNFDGRLNIMALSDYILKAGDFYDDKGYVKDVKMEVVTVSHDSTTVTVFNLSEGINLREIESTSGSFTLDGLTMTLIAG